MIDRTRTPTAERPALLFYCQHSLGLGHLVRSLALVGALAEHFDVVLLNGGRLPEATVVPDGVELINLVPLGHDDHYELVSHDPNVDVSEAQRRRVEVILDTVDRLRPAAVFVELFPFGRKKFAFELDPLLDAVSALGTSLDGVRPAVFCSLRDILVNQRRDQARHDERAAQSINRFFDAVFVHADPAFARLEESFVPETALTVPVLYTGFVAPPATARRVGKLNDRVVVSAGGGMVGEPLFLAAVDAAAAVKRRTGFDTHIVAGPFLPEAAWAWLQNQTRPGLTVVRRVDDLASEIEASRVSVSQCGYNTTMDLLRAGTPAVVVPFSEGKEDEQRRRAERLARLGVLEVVDSSTLSAATLVEAVAAAAHRPTPTVELDLDGAANTARFAIDLVARRSVDVGVGVR